MKKEYFPPAWLFLGSVILILIAIGTAWTAYEARSLTDWSYVCIIGALILLWEALAWIAKAWKDIRKGYFWL